MLLALNIRQLWVNLAQSRSDESALPQMASAKEDIAALQVRAITGHNNIFRDGERHGYSESAIGDDARTIRARMPSFKETVTAQVRWMRSDFGR